MIGDRTRTAVIAVVTSVWAANFIASVVVPDYEPTESINGIFMAIVGGLFAIGARQQQSSGDSEKKSEKKNGEKKAKDESGPADSPASGPEGGTEGAG